MYLESVYSDYKDILGLGDAKRLPIPVTVKSSEECQGGISGGKENGDLGYCAGQWASNEFCYGILAHELCNLFTGEQVSGGWPTAWWANHRSPFPTMIANEAMKGRVPEFYRRWGDYNDPLVIMFEKFYNQNEGMFPRMFQKMKQLQISLQLFSEPYLSHVIYYFMFYGARSTDLAKHFVVPPMPSVNPGWLQEIERRFNLSVL